MARALAAVIGVALVRWAVAGGNPVQVAWTWPVGGESLTARDEVTLRWDAEAPQPPGNGIGRVDVLASFDGGATWELVAAELTANSVQWFVKLKPTADARLRLIVHDILGNVAEAVTGPLQVVRVTPDALISTTDRDFEGPGTAPIGFVRSAGEVISHTPITDPEECMVCHGQYDPLVAPTDHWRGSMMAYASIDPLWKAAVEINDRVAPGAGDICLRCHVPSAWLAGRSNPSDGRAVQLHDQVGVSCELCHRLVDPHFDPQQSPFDDQQILAELPQAPSVFGNALYVVDPNEPPYIERRRGPFTDVFCLHSFAVSPFHTEAALCGTCHDVSNPAIDLLPGSQGAPNALDAPAGSFAPTAIMSEQRTYSEWFYSAFNSPQGVYAPQFGGNRDYVASCQDCHMRDATGRACIIEAAPIRTNQPLHDLTGANTWIPSLLDQVDPRVVEPVVQTEPGVFVELGSVWIQDGIQRARYMLQNAADLFIELHQNRLRVKVTNLTGHKLPTGYPEGRSMWLNVRFYDGADQLLAESGAYDASTGLLVRDSQIKVYEAVAVVNQDLAQQIGLPPGTTNFLSLSNQWVKDNRIPPLGFSNTAYAAFGGAPIGAAFAEGQNWDYSVYELPSGARRAEVRLFYQTMSREYAEFLRDAGGAGSLGHQMYDLWRDNGKSPPEQMASRTFALPPGVPGDMNCDGGVDANDIPGFVLALTDPTGYSVEYPGCDALQADMNGDAQATVGDLGPFVNLLLGN